MKLMTSIKGWKSNFLLTLPGYILTLHIVFSHNYYWSDSLISIATSQIAVLILIFLPAQQHLNYCSLDPGLWQVSESQQWEARRNYKQFTLILMRGWSEALCREEHYESRQSMLLTLLIKQSDIHSSASSSSNKLTRLSSWDSWFHISSGRLSDTCCVKYVLMLSTSSLQKLVGVDKSSWMSSQSSMSSNSTSSLVGTQPMGRPLAGMTPSHRPSPVKMNEIKLYKKIFHLESTEWLWYCLRSLATRVHHSDPSWTSWPWRTEEASLAVCPYPASAGDSLRSCNQRMVSWRMGHASPAYPCAQLKHQSSSTTLLWSDTCCSGLRLDAGSHEDPMLPGHCLIHQRNTSWSPPSEQYCWHRNTYIENNSTIDSTEKYFSLLLLRLRIKTLLLLWMIVHLQDPPRLDPSWDSWREVNKISS